MAQAQAADRRSNKNEKKDELVEKLVHINRVAKTVKGGRNMSFAAVVVVGDQKGRVGYGSGKATEVPDAITKATNEAKKNMVRIPLREGRTLHHDVAGRFGAGKVVLRTAPAGTGVIAGGPMRAIFEVLGVQDVVAKSLGSTQQASSVEELSSAVQELSGQATDEANKAVDAGKLSADAIDLASLMSAGIVTKALDGVRLLARGAITSKVTVSVNSASKAAVAAVEKAGGKVNFIEA